MSAITGSYSGLPDTASLTANSLAESFPLTYDFDIPSAYQFDEIPFDDALQRQGRREMAADFSRLAPQNDDFAPFPNKATFVLALMSKNPRRPLSTRQIKTIILSRNLLGVPNVPTYDQYQTALNRVRSITGSQIVPVTGLSGTEIYIKPIADGIVALRMHTELRAEHFSDSVRSPKSAPHGVGHGAAKLTQVVCQLRAELPRNSEKNGAERGVTSAGSVKKFRSTE
ncbi:hypothetical protein V8E36_008092 [Tilletia maclaganii]